MSNDFQLPSNRKFGFLFTGLCTLLSLYAAFQSDSSAKVYAWVIFAILVGLVTVVAPSLLTPLNRAWMKLGALMGKVVSPVVLSLIFFTVITPIAVIIRIFGRDALRLKKANVNSFWIDRQPADNTSDSFKNQF